MQTFHKEFLCGYFISSSISFTISGCCSITIVGSPLKNRSLLANDRLKDTTQLFSTKTKKHAKMYTGLRQQWNQTVNVSMMLPHHSDNRPISFSLAAILFWNTSEDGQKESNELRGYIMLTLILLFSILNNFKILKIVGVDYRLNIWLARLRLLWGFSKAFSRFFNESFQEF